MRVAGRCTAAKAQALATNHDGKQYRILGMDREDFCTHPGVQGIRPPLFRLRAIGAVSRGAFTLFFYSMTAA
jgi:hypothetical protein